MSAGEEDLNLNNVPESEFLADSESIKNLEDDMEAEEPVARLDASNEVFELSSQKELEQEQEQEQEQEEKPVSELHVRHRNVTQSTEKLEDSLKAAKEECAIAKPEPEHEQKAKASGSESDSEDLSDEKEPLMQFHLTEGEDSERNSISSSVASRMAYARSCAASARPASLQRPKPTLVTSTLCNIWFVILEIFEFITLFFVTLFNPNVDVTRQIESFNQRRAERMHARRSGSFGPSSSDFKPSFPGCGCGG